MEFRVSAVNDGGPGKPSKATPPHTVKDQICEWGKCCWLPLPMLSVLSERDVWILRERGVDQGGRENKGERGRKRRERVCACTYICVCVCVCTNYMCVCVCVCVHMLAVYLFVYLVRFFAIMVVSI